MGEDGVGVDCGEGAPTPTPTASGGGDTRGSEFGFGFGFGFNALGGSGLITSILAGAGLGAGGIEDENEEGGVADAGLGVGADGIEDAKFDEGGVEVDVEAAPTSNELDRLWLWERECECERECEERWTCSNLDLVAFQRTSPPLWRYIPSSSQCYKPSSYERLVNLEVVGGRVRRTRCDTFVKSIFHFTISCR